MSSMHNFTLIFFLMTQCSQKSNLQVLTPFSRPYFARACKSFPCMSEPHTPQPGAIIIWNCRSRYLTCNHTTLQVVKAIASDDLRNNYRASSHLENTISNRYFKSQCFQGTNSDKIPFQLRHIPHFLQFSHYPIKRLDMYHTYPFYVAWTIITHNNIASI